MKERYRKIHDIKYKTEQRIGIATHIWVYRNGEQKSRSDTPFLYVEFGWFYQVFCLQSIVLDCEQDVS